MQNIKKLITAAGLMLVTLGCAGLIAITIFLIQLIYNPSSLPLIKTIMPNLQPGQAMTVIFSGTPLNIQISANLRNIIMGFMALTITATATETFIKATTTGMSLLRLTKAGTKTPQQNKPDAIARNTLEYPEREGPRQATPKTTKTLPHYLLHKIKENWHKAAGSWD